ncbi:MAG TPA: hypothetical protein VHU80_00135, partial [Polyangiaceae bacterium]|nr:hypothetical protein [Polyangiaceae bacterium]
TKIQGYFLIAELEQIYTLGQTLCFLFGGGSYPNWQTDSHQDCRHDPNFNPLDPVKGLPPGDWCSTTNGLASGDCHDAWQSVSYSTFQAFPIADGTCPTL